MNPRTMAPLNPHQEPCNLQWASVYRHAFASRPLMAALKMPTASCIPSSSLSSVGSSSPGTAYFSEYFKRWSHFSIGLYEAPQWACLIRAGQENRAT
jgi:hypothetical protein